MSEDLKKHAVKIFSNKIERELKEKSCGCNGCTCKEFVLPNLSLGKPSIVSRKYSMDFDVNTSDRRIKVSDILTPSQLDKLIELQPNAVTQIIEAHYRNTPSNTIKP